VAAIEKRKKTSGTDGATRKEISTPGMLDVVQAIPAYLAVDTTGRKPKQSRGLRLIALFSVKRGFQ
jgi:hypothetical protein